MLSKLVPDCCIEVICQFCSVESFQLSFPSPLVCPGCLSLTFMSVTCIIQLTLPCIKCTAFQREKMPSSHELPNLYNKLAIKNLYCFKRFAVELAYAIKTKVSMYIPKSGVACKPFRIYFRYIGIAVKLV